MINDYLLPKWKQKWTAQGKKVDRHKETKKNSSLVLGLQQIKIKANVFESLVSPKKNSEHYMNIRWAPQHLVCKASRKDNTAVQSQGIP